MNKKLHKSIYISCLAILLACLSFLFVACGCSKKSETPKSNVFQDTVDYLKEHGRLEQDEYIYTLSNVPNTGFGSSLIYNSTKNSLSLGGDNNEFQDFSLTIPFSNDYSTVTSYTITAEGQSQFPFQAEFELPTVSYTNMNNTTSLPSFDIKNKQGEPITDSDVKQFRSSLSATLNTILTEYNNFYVEKVKNGDKRYNGAIYQYFHLPIIQVESI